MILIFKREDNDNPIQYKHILLLISHIQNVFCNNVDRNNSYFKPI